MNPVTAQGALGERLFDAVRCFELADLCEHSGRAVLRLLGEVGLEVGEYGFVIDDHPGRLRR